MVETRDSPVTPTSTPWTCCIPDYSLPCMLACVPPMKGINALFVTFMLRSTELSGQRAGEGRSHVQG
jgi:hypothetical protein